MPKITPEAAQKRSKEKVDQIMALAKGLDVTVSAAQRVNRQTGVIETVVLWSDNEQYDIEKPENVPLAPLEPVEVPSAPVPTGEPGA